MHNLTKSATGLTGGVADSGATLHSWSDNKSRPIEFSLFSRFSHFLAFFFFLFFCCLYFDCRLSVFWGEKVTIKKNCWITKWNDYPLPLPRSYSAYDRLFAQLFKQIFRPGVARRAARFGLPFKNRFCFCCFRGLSENSNSNIYQEFDGVIGGGVGVA